MTRNDSYTLQVFPYKDESKRIIRIVTAPNYSWKGKRFIVTNEQLESITISRPNGKNLVHYNPDLMIGLFQKAFPKGLRAVNARALEDKIAEYVTPEKIDDDSKDI